MARGFNLTANLVIDTSKSLPVAVQKIKAAFNQMTGTINIKIDPRNQLGVLQKKLEDIKKLAASGLGTIGIKVKGATTKQIENINGLAKALKKIRPELRGFADRNISIKATTPTKASIEKIKDLAIWLKMVSPVLKNFQNKDIKIGLRAPTTKAIANINAANIALKQIQPVLASMGGGANIGIKITGLGSKRLSGFAVGLGNVSKQLKTTMPDLHRLNTALGQKITHLERFKQAATAAGQSLGALGKSSTKVQSGLSRTATSVKNIANQTKQATSFMYEFGKSGGLAVKRFGAFTLATSVVFGFIYAVGNAIKEAIDFEKQMAKIAQISKTTILGVQSISDAVTRLSIQYGTASKDLLEISQIFAQAGFRGYELKKALDAVAKSDLAPTFTNMKNTGEGLIAMMGQFNIKAGDFEGVLGSINELSAKYAVEADDLITAVRLFGGVFANASNKAKGGVKQLQEMLALFTSLRSTSRQSAETIATGLRTIITRIQRPGFAKFVRETFGTDIEDAEGNFIGVWEAINKLSAATKNLNTGTEKFRKLSEEVGGYRQAEKTLGVLKQWSLRMEALGVAEKGEMSIEGQMETQLQTLSRRIVQVTEDFKRLIREIVGSSSFKLMADLALTAASAFIKLADALKPILPMLSALLLIRGSIGAVQFARGAISNLATGGGAVGAGMASVRAGGVTGFGNLFNNPYNFLGRPYQGIGGRLRNAGFFQPIPSRPSPMFISPFIQAANQQAAQRIFPGVTGLQNKYMPQIDKILSPVVKNLAKSFGVNTRAFNVAMTQVNETLRMFRRNIMRGMPVPSTANLTQQGILAAMSDRRGKFGRGISIIGSETFGAAANNAGSLLMAGMLLQASTTNVRGGLGAGLQTTGGILTGAGIGGMMGGPWGVAIGGVIGGINALANALGPEKVRQANEDIAKELEKMTQKFSEMNNINLNTVEGTNDLNNAFANLAFGMENISNRINQTQPRGEFENIVSNPSRSFMTGLRGFLSNRWASGYVSPGIVSIATAFNPVRKWLGLDNRNVGRENLEINTEQRNQAIQYLQGGLLEQSKMAVDKYYQRIFRGENLTPDQMKNAEISALFGSTSMDKNIRTMMQIMLRGGMSEEEQRRIGRQNLTENAPVQKAAEGLQTLIFQFDALKKTLEQLDNVLSAHVQMNKILSQSTDAYFNRAMGGPGSTTPIIQQRINPFKIPGAYSPGQLINAMNSIGLGGTQIAGNILLGRQLETAMPQFLQQIRGNTAAFDVRSVERQLLGEGGMFANAPRDIQASIREYFDEMYKDNKIDVDKIAKINEIMGNDYKNSLDIAANLFDEKINRRLEVIAKIIEQQLQIQQRIREISMESLTRNQEFAARRANLITTESLSAQANRLGGNRLQQLQLLGINPLNIGQNVFGGNGQIGLLNLLNNAERAMNAAITDEQRIAQGGVIKDLMNTLNRNVEALKILTDVDKQLTNVEQQILKQQQKREAGRTLIGRLQGMGAAERVNLQEGLVLASIMQQGGEMPQMSSQQYMRMQDALNFMSEFSGNISTGGQQNLEALMAMSARGWTRAAGINGNGEVSGLIGMAGTERGKTPEEQQLIKTFDYLVGEAKRFAEILSKINELQLKYAQVVGQFELAQSKRNIDNATFIIEKSVTIRQEALNMGGQPIGGAQHGARLAGTGPIPILAHGGELIVPKNKVDQGLSGVIDFARNQGLMFAKGGRVPTLEELKNSAISKIQQLPIEEYIPEKPDIEKSVETLINNIRQQKTKVGLLESMKTPGIYVGDSLRNAAYNIVDETKEEMLSWRNKPLSAYELGQKQKREQFIKGKQQQQIEVLRRKRAYYGEKLSDQDVTKIKLKTKGIYTNKRPDQESINKYAKIRTPFMLSPAELDPLVGAMSFPTILKGDIFKTDREVLEKIFRKRAELGFLTEDEQKKKDDVINRIKSLLKQNIDNIIPQSYIEAKEYLQGLLIENREAGRGIRRGSLISVSNLSQKIKTSEPKKRIFDSAIKIKQNEFNTPLITYRPEYYNQRYGQGFATGFDPNKLQETNLVKAQKVAMEEEKRRTSGLQQFSNEAISESQALARMRNTGQRARNYINKGLGLGNTKLTKLNEIMNPSPAQKLGYYLRGISKYGVGDKLAELKIREEEINKILPKLASGTPEVTRTGAAEIHRGESILPARDIQNFTSAIKLASETLNSFNRGFGTGKELGGNVGKSPIDDAIVKAANILAEIKIPEKIILEFGTINHNVNFNGGDVLAQQVAQQIAEKAGQMIQKQLAAIISPVNGEILTG